MMKPMFQRGALFAGFTALLFGCSESEPQAAAAKPVTDKPIDAYRTDLLDLAFEAVSKFPLELHHKNRSRAQDAVVAACFELDQPQRALRFAHDIRDWRRGAAYADYAYYCAKHGDRSKADEYLEKARKIADGVETSENPQQWRRDRVLSKIARTHVLLGDLDNAERVMAGTDASQTGAFEAEKAMMIDESALEREFEILDGVFARGNFDEVVNAIGKCLRLFDRLYEQENLRVRAADLVENGFPKLPSSERLKGLIGLAKIALDHGDSAAAIDFTRKAQKRMDAVRWHAEDGVPLKARLATMFGRAGDEKSAREDLVAALELFKEQKRTIADMFRGAALRPIAEGYHAIGDRKMASQMYELALSAGVENPNSRPRANDLSATCISMAIHEFRPDAKLRTRMGKICERLGDPW